jgi:enterochelin esterase family protein
MERIPAKKHGRQSHRAGNRKISFFFPFPSLTPTADCSWIGGHWTTRPAIFAVHQPTDERIHMYQENLRFLRYESQLLKGFPLVNGTHRLLPVLLPPGYSERQRYPTIWMLDGYLGTGRSLMSESGFLGESLGSQLTRLMQEDILPHCIFVFPDPTTRFGGSQFIDSTVCGPFMRHIVEELVPFIDSSFSTVSRKDGRVVCGHSSGGYGALMISMLKPGFFGYCIASAADSAFELSMANGFPTAAARIKKCGGEEAFLRYFFSQPRPEKCSKEDFLTLMTLAMGTCYSPDPSRSGVWCQLPFEIETCTLIDEVWQQWLKHDPCRLVMRHADELKKLRWLHLDCGSEDEFSAQFGHRRIAACLQENRVEHLHTEFSGGHSGTSFRWQFRFTELAPFLRSFAAR